LIIIIINAVITTTIWRAFDVHSTAYVRSLVSRSYAVR